MRTPQSSTEKNWRSSTRARVAVDLDHGDVGAEGIDEVGRPEVLGGLEPRLEARRQPLAVGTLGDLRQRQALRGHALHLVAAVGQLDVLEGRLEHAARRCGGPSPAPCPTAFSMAEPPTARLRLPPVPKPMGVVDGVAVAHDHLVELHAELIRDDLGERRLMPLAVGGGAGEGGDGAARLDAHHGALVRAEAAHLDVARHADAEEPAILLVDPPLLLGAQRLRSATRRARASAPGRTRRCRSAAPSAPGTGRRSAG